MSRSDVSVLQEPMVFDGVELGMLKAMAAVQIDGYSSLTAEMGFRISSSV